MKKKDGKHYCIKCDRWVDTEEVVVSLGFVDIKQERCFFCGKALGVDFRKTGELVFTKKGVKIEKSVRRRGL